MRGQKEKTEAVAMVRDLFGSVLFLSLQRNVDMAEVFWYPLAPVPLSFCHTDGTILNSPKAKLLTELESRVKPEAPTKIDAAVVDGMFFLYLLVDSPKTLKQTAVYLLRKMFNGFNCKNIHLVFDKVVCPSIMDLERNKRSSTRQDLFTITGPTQTQPSDWEAALEMDSFKTSFAEFLVSYWENDEFFPSFENKQLFVNCEDRCFKFFAEGNCVLKAEIEELFSTHEEADSRMLFHVYYIPTPSEIVIRTVDTDVLIIAFGVMDQLDPRKVLWLEAGVQGKNMLQYISITKMFQNLCKFIAILVGSPCFDRL